VVVHYARRKGAKLILNQNGVAYYGWHGPGWEKANKPMAEILHQADYVFFQSKFCKMSADRFLGERKSPFEILCNPVDTKVFKPTSVHREGAKLLLAGSHHNFYRVRTAIEAMSYLVKDVPDACLTIAGRYMWKPKQEEALAEAKDLADELGVAQRVDLRGEYSQAEAVLLMQQSHILLHTKYNDPCPRLVVEAMSCGLPIVYSHSGGVPELVGEDAGVGVSAPLDWEQDHPPDPQELARAVVDVVSDHKRFSKAARARAVARFDVRPWLERHRIVFESLVSNKPLLSPASFGRSSSQPPARRAYTPEGDHREIKTPCLSETTKTLFRVVVDL
jgi:glycosyltransferase involved in cell wall biosynthesis